MKQQIAWLSLGANNCNPRPPPRTRKPKPCSETDKNVNGKKPLETTTPQLTQSTVWQDMSRPLYSGCEQDTVACERTWSKLASWTLHSAIAKKRNRRSTHPPGLSHLVTTETAAMATGWVNHQQAVGNGGRPAPHHPIPGSMWTEGLSTADRLQKKKIINLQTL